MTLEAVISINGYFDEHLYFYRLASTAMRSTRSGRSERVSWTQRSRDGNIV
jgi:hypothetical protein